MAKKQIYFAGGCFWGVEKFMSSLPGVLSATSGYANAQINNPTYEEVKTGNTLARECVVVEYDTNQIHLRTLVFSYFSIIDPTQENRQGHDIGSQYQTGIYYIDELDKEVIDDVISIESERAKSMKVEVKPLDNFFEAEQYHQKYLDKNPQGYCHVPFGMMQKAKNLKVDASLYYRLSEDEIKKRCEEYSGVLINTENGEYVDITTNEPLFKEVDKIYEDEQCIEFKEPIDGFVVINQGGRLLSRIGNVYLGEIVLKGEQEIYKIKKYSLY